MGHFCPPGYGSGYGSTDLIESGSETLPGVITLTFLQGSDCEIWRAGGGHHAQVTGQFVISQLIQ
jgi:hypothetical protein